MGYTAVYDNIVLIGFMGSGKTSIGKILAKQLFKNFADVDTIIEAEQGASVTEIFKTKGEEHFRELEQKCINELTQKKRSSHRHRWWATDIQFHLREIAHYIYRC